MELATCAVCNVPGSENVSLKRCTKCKAISHSSKTCQTLDWQTHKLLCRQFETLGDTPRPSENYVLALLLSELSSHPTIFCMKVHKGTQDGKEIEKLDFAGTEIVIKPSDPNEPAPKVLRMTELLHEANPDLQRFAINHNVLLIKRAEDWRVPSTTNGCFDRIISSEGAYPFNGPMVILASPDTSSIIKTYQDFVAADLRILVDFFRAYDDDDKESCDVFRASTSINAMNELSDGAPGVQLDREAIVKGVVVNCLGDRNILGKPHFEEVEVKGNHEAFKLKPTAISTQIDLPLITCKLAPDTAWKTKTLGSLAFNPYENEEIIYMNRHIDVDKPDFGWASLRQWNLRIGSVLIVRADGKDISTQQVEALAAFNRLELERMFNVLEMEYAGEAFEVKR